ncbi:hypothetical protein GALMADRAFT_361430 [Galerina marginata CBS 339.88]|uniref:G-protein coupled receptors family 1 profile domain-containing protein n=1 Tax=Galerina marginata (strain CBS 339.88) TaxID=685588 RepID=A0A067TQM9_GALM3|nr:hypothetical protein GALMADRAFT_361430 [Galerina marginata CBS 339.88]
MPPYFLEISTASRQDALLSLGHLRPVFLTLHTIGGLVGLPLLVLTFLLSSKIPRQPALINFCIAWSISCDDLRSSSNVGVRNVYGSLIWRMFQDPTTRRAYTKRHCSERFTLIFRLAMPYIIYIIFLVISIVLQVKFPQSLDRRNGLYCTVAGIPFRHWSVPIVSIVFLLLMLVFECSIVIRYYFARKLIVSSFPLASRTTSGGLIIRITLFNVYLLITFGASIVFLSGEVQVWAYMIQASVPLAAFVLFATQRNVIHTWCFWLQEEVHSDDSMPHSRKPETDRDINLTSAICCDIEGQVAQRPNIVPSTVVTEAP